MIDSQFTLGKLEKRPYVEFVGRDEELKKLKDYLRPRNRDFIFVISGTGGVGKTSLALEIAHYYQERDADLSPDERFAHIIWTSAKTEDYTPKGRKRRAQYQATLAAILESIARQMQLPVALTGTEERQMEIIEDALTKSRVLLLIDNFDTITNTDAVTNLFAKLSATQVKIIATSRVDSIKERSIYIPLQRFGEAEALRLINLQCNLVPQLQINQDQRLRIVEVTQGLPLSISIFLGRLRINKESYHDLISEFAQGGPADFSDFSFQGLLESLRGRKTEDLLVALIPVDSPVKPEQLEAITRMDLETTENELESIKGLHSISEASNRRIRLTSLVREYLLSHIQEEKVNDFRIRWAEYYLEFVRELVGGYGRADRYSHDSERKIREEIDNIQGILRSIFELEQRLYCELLQAVRYITYSHGNWVARDQLMLNGIKAANEVGEPCKAALFASDLAWTAAYNRLYSKAERLLDEAESYLRTCPEPFYRAKVLRDKARLLFFKGEEEAAEVLYIRAINEAKNSVLVPTEVITCQYYLALLYYDIKNTTQSKIYIDEALRLADEKGATREAARLEALLAQIEAGEAHVDQARNRLERVISLAENYKDWVRVADYKLGQAKIEQRVGNIEGASILADEAATLYKQLGRVRDEELVRAYRQRFLTGERGRGQF